MGLPLWTCRDGHLVRDSAAYAAAQTHAIGKLRARGRAVAVYTAPDPIVARINENRWIVDCVCGSGCYVDLDAETPVVAAVLLLRGDPYAGRAARGSPGHRSGPPQAPARRDPSLAAGRDGRSARGGEYRTWV